MKKSMKSALIWAMIFVFSFSLVGNLNTWANQTREVPGVGGEVMLILLVFVVFVCWLNNRIEHNDAIKRKKAADRLAIKIKFEKEMKEYKAGKEEIFVSSFDERQSGSSRKMG